jgi:adenosylmethionine-8-amino-7-oxononanoate aminotransferase
MKPYHYLAEFISTIFVGFIAIYTANPVAVGSAFALIYLLAKTSANPSITMAEAYYKRKYDATFEMQSVSPVIVVQCGGALVAVELYKRMH